MIKFEGKKMSPKQYAQEVLQQTLLVRIEAELCSSSRDEEMSAMTDKEREEMMRQIDLLVARALKVVGGKNK